MEEEQKKIVQIGIYNHLKVIKKVDFGVYLEGGKFGEILLPKRYVPKDFKIGDFLEVFIYRDSEDRVIATTEKPYAQVGEFAFLKAAEVSQFGAFLDWGLMKDLLVHFREQKENQMEKGKWYVVRVCLDEKTERIFGSARIEKYLDKEPSGCREKEEVDLIIYGKNDLGFKAVINNSHIGLVYKNEVFVPLEIGQKVKGYVKKIKEDGKIDLCLQKEGYEKIGGAAEDILEKLKKAGGFIAVTDKSAPEFIYGMFGISKKTYKKSIGALLKKKLIAISDDGIRLKK